MQILSACDFCEPTFWINYVYWSSFAQQLTLNLNQIFPQQLSDMYKNPYSPGKLPWFENPADLLSFLLWLHFQESATRTVNNYVRPSHAAWSFIKTVSPCFPTNQTAKWNNKVTDLHSVSSTRRDAAVFESQRPKTRRLENRGPHTAYFCYSSVWYPGKTPF